MRKLLMLAGAVLVLSSPAKADEYTVKMVSNPDAEQVYSFEPEELTIQPGDTVTWVNEQDDIHNAVADAGPEGAELFESPMLEEAGQSWSVTLDVEGTYSYHCHPHAAMGMRGTIVVGTPSEPEEIHKAPGHEHHHHNHGNHDH